MANFLTRLFGSANERMLKRLWPLVHEISDLEAEVEALPPEAFPERTTALKDRIAAGETEPDDVIAEAFALVREASRRTIGLRHYDVQLLGGMVLHKGMIAEMKTGEGKTLVATLPLYLNALVGKGAHLVTVNDYLARRDVQWMGPVYHYLGLSVGSIIHDASFLFDPSFIPKDYRFLHLRPCDRRAAYRADVTYGTNNEFGFDYLRDNMKYALDEYAQRELHFGIVDEVDNILIDEARTPLIISGPAEASSQLYTTVNRIIPRLTRDVDYTIDEKHKNAMLTEEGVAKSERLLGVANLYDPSQIAVLHHVQQALKAHVLFKRDVDYVVKDGQVIIVDEFTGRLMEGRRWSDGLHQAVEAKEGVTIESENQTLATITIQNYFRMYAKLAGMTGTADTEAVEFKKTYKLEVAVIPPNKTNRRSDYADVVYRTEPEKFAAVVEEIKGCHEKGQPVLVGTTSVKVSEHVSKLLKRAGVRHNVLNAINHEAEANIIAQAGRLGQVTIATNMAGRGTDILLGGNPEFLARAEMENEWMREAGKLTGAAVGAQRYEDALRALRERYEEDLQHLEAEYGAALGSIEERRSEALQKLTEADRRLRELSPYQALRARYERVSSVDFIPAVRDRGPVPARYREAKAEMEQALLGADQAGGVPAERGELDQVRARFDEALAAWDDQGRRSDALGRALDERRAEYEQALAQLELALMLKGPVAGNGELAEWQQAFREAEDTYVAAEREDEAARVPYEQARRAIERRFEEQSAQMRETVEELREELQKAPQLYEARYKDIMAGFQQRCAEEREQVVAAGGLHIVGTERHEARRIDNQLRGRAGRQGDPGSSRFFLSLQDDLLRIFGADRMQNLMQRLGMEEGVPIEHRFVTRAIRNAQEKVEGHNFDMRKHLLEYDDVLNKQREVVYARRRELLSRDDLSEDVLEVAESLAEELVATYCSEEQAPEDWDLAALDDAVFQQFNQRLHLPEVARDAGTIGAIAEMAVERVKAAYAERERTFTPPIMRHLERLIWLQTLDTLWRDHLLSMDHLKEGIGLRGYGQKNPLQEYQKEGYELFQDLIHRMESDIVEKLMTVQVQAAPAAQARPAQAMGHVRPPFAMRPPVAHAVAAAGGAAAGAGDAAGADGDPGVAAAMARELEAMEQRAQRATQKMRLSGPATEGPQKVETVRRDDPKVGRNDPCPCGSGKKYKKCHGTA